MTITAEGSVSNESIVTYPSSSTIYTLNPNETINLTFTASEPITGFSQSSITFSNSKGDSASNGTISNFSGSGATYTASFEPTMVSNSTIANSNNVPDNPMVFISKYMKQILLSM